MAQVLTDKKNTFLNALVTYAGQAESLVRTLAELNSYFTDNGFATGGGNAIVDADCTGPNSHLTAALVNSAMTALTNVNLTGAQKTTLRQVSTLPVPG